MVSTLELAECWVPGTIFPSPQSSQGELSLVLRFGGFCLVADLHSDSFQTDFSRFSERGAKLAVKPSYYLKETEHDAYRGA
jgi:hypothetical protein